MNSTTLFSLALKTVSNAAVIYLLIEKVTGH